jgi:hypothetical protein
VSVRRGLGFVIGIIVLAVFVCSPRSWRCIIVGREPAVTNRSTPCSASAVS